MIKDTILKTIEEHNLIAKDMHIVIGLSGGPDSVCLFTVLKELAQSLQLHIHPVHINHQIRPGAAEHDQKYVEDLCKEAGLTCRTVVFDCNQMAADEGLTSEEAGRKVRYQAFDDEAKAVEDSGVPRDMIKIAVAHNADDQAETIMFRLLRGTGTDGLAGMEYSRTDELGYEIIRPLLDVWKADIMAFCKEETLDPCMDYTNAQPVYARNRIRLELLPFLEDYNPNIKEAIVRLGKVAACDREYLQGEAEAALSWLINESDDNYIVLDGKKLRGLGKPVRQRVVSLVFKELGLIEDMTFAHFEDADQLIFNDKPSARLDLPHGYHLTKVYDDVKAAKDSDDVDTEEKIIMEIVSKEEFNAEKHIKGSFAAFDADAIAEEYGQDFAKVVKWRTRNPGDHISLAGGGSKKLQDLFVNEKVPKDERDKIKVFAIGSEVLFVPKTKLGIQRSRYSAKYVNKEATKKVFFVEIFG